MATSNQGSSMCSISVIGGISEGLSTSTTEPSVFCTWYATLGAVAMRLRSYSERSPGSVASLFAS